MKRIGMFATWLLRIMARICGSDIFLYFVIGWFIIEAVWIAVSFRYPLVFDERYHLGVIDYFANHLSPIALHQASRYDTYGNMAYSNASLYHFIMSFPYRVIAYFTNNFETQVILLRILNVLLAASSLWLFARLFQELGIRKVFANLALFFYSIIPVVLFVSATISYDNMLLPLTAYFFLIGTRIVNKQVNISFQDYIKFMLVGLLACLVKFTFLPIFIVGIGCLAIRGFRKNRRQYIGQLLAGFMKDRSPRLYLLMSLGVLLLGLFSIRYIYPVLNYGTPLPDCRLVMSEDRCLKGSVYFATQKIVQTKATRGPVQIEVYAEQWVQNMASQFDESAANTGTRIEFGKTLPLLSLLLISSVFVGLAVLVYMWRSMDKTEGWHFSITLIVVFFIVLFAFNAMSYYSANMDLNTQTRYSLSVLPIVLVMSLVAINRLLEGRPGTKLILLVAVIFLCTQGGGDIRHILASNDSWYWGNPTMTHINDHLRNVLKPLVKQ
jgi:hypothetical protein